MMGTRRKTAPGEHLEQVGKGTRRQQRPIIAGRKAHDRTRHDLRIPAGIGDCLRHRRGIERRPAPGRLDRLAVAAAGGIAWQMDRPVEGHPLTLIPLPRSRGAAKTARKRTGRAEPDQVCRAGSLGNGVHEGGTIEHRLVVGMHLAIVALSRVAIDIEQGVGGTVGEHMPKRSKRVMHRAPKIAATLLQARQGQLVDSLTIALNQPDASHRPLDPPSLSQARAVDPHKLRALSLERRAGKFARRASGLDRLGKFLESGPHAHPSPPKTSMPRNRQGGDAWPTRITCPGSPLPQNGVPSTSTPAGSPTAARLLQKVAETPR